MDTLVLNGLNLKQLAINGSIKLKNNMDRINQLNVFPVPDGDTGSNMSATMSAGAKAVSASEEASIGVMAKILARGMLMGARGNSGVILSQLFSGLANGLKEKNDVSVEEFALALRKGVEQAYTAVINPVEGTMLTVAREGADHAISVSESVQDFENLFSHYIQEMKESLERTPELLPVLKEVGVVDSGGAGYLEIVEGMYDALLGNIYEVATEDAKAKAAPQVQMDLSHFGSDIDFGYCTEFIMQIEKMDEFNQKDFTHIISQLGDSLVVVQDENILKVHVHTKTPGDALNLAQHWGYFINIKIENMTLQHTEVLIHQPAEDACSCGHTHSYGTAPKIKKKYALVAVVNGDGLKDTFIEMGCDYIVEGGQTMNPSIEDFINACETINADYIILIPNNKNVLLSAEHAAKLIDDKQVYVLPAKTISQGYAALTMFDATQDVETNLKDMQSHIQNVRTGEVTYAIRQSTNNGISINKDDYMGIQDGKIVVSNPDRLETTKALLSSLIDQKSEIVTLMVGADVSSEEVDLVTEFIEDQFNAELEIIEGGQDIYSYIIAVG